MDEIFRSKILMNRIAYQNGKYTLYDDDEVTVYGEYTDTEWGVLFMEAHGNRDQVIDGLKKERDLWQRCAEYAQKNETRMIKMVEFFAHDVSELRKENTKLEKKARIFDQLLAGDELERILRERCDEYESCRSVLCEEVRMEMHRRLEAR